MSAGALSLRKISGKNYGAKPTSVVAAYGDQYWNQTSLLLLGNGSTGLQNSTAIDSSASPYAITASGTPAQGTFSPVAGMGSCYFNASTDYFQATGYDVAALGNGDFTIECWFNAADVVTTRSILSTFSAPAAADGKGISVEWVAGSKMAFYSFAYNGSAAPVVVQTSTCSLNTWYHIAVTKQGTTHRLFINGNLEATAIAAYTVVAGGAMVIGSSLYGVAARTFNGYIAGFRVIKGAALYTASFTVPSTPPTAVAGTSLLLNFGNAGVYDSTGKNNVKIGGTVAPSSSVVKYGVSSINFTGSSSIVLQDSPSFELGASDFTIEFWVNTTQTTQYATLISRSTAAFATGMWTLMLNSAAAGSGAISLWAYEVNAGAAAVMTTTGVNVIDGSWHHVSMTRMGSAWTIWVDGISRATATSAATIADLASGPFIGMDQFIGRYYTGYLDDFRFTLGVARYKGNFQPPISELPSFYGSPTTDDYWTQTTLLLHGDGANGANNASIIDSSVNNLTDTVVGTPTQGSFTPFPVTANSGKTYVASINGGSCYFNGTTDYLTYVATDAMNDIGTVSMPVTIEAWVYPTSFATDGTVIGRGGSVYGWNASNGVAYYLHLNTTTGIPSFHYFIGGTSTTSATAASGVALNAWTHLAVVWDGVSSTKLYVNGALAATTSGAYVAPTTNTTLAVGAVAGGSASSRFAGYISNLRFVRGTAVYTTGFTVPPAPLTPIANTQLLLSFNNAAIIDQTCKTNLQVVGSAATMVSVNKFGGSSLYFNGTTDYLKSPTMTQLQGGPFTVEAWLYPSQVTTGFYVFTQVGTTSDWSATGYSFDCTTTGAFPLFELKTGVGTLASATSSIALVANTWQHVAWVYDGTNAKIFVNGVQGVSTAIAHAASSAPNSIIGAGSAGASPYGGYIDDYRITKGLARYTANFIPPTAALPDR
jgi:hypothetical protein